MIIGGGATGVELAAELREASSLHAQYGLRHIDAARDVRIRILEGAPRLLAPLAENVSAAATRLLAQRHVDVNTSCRVVRIDAEPGDRCRRQRLSGRPVRVGRRHQGAAAAGARSACR